MHFNICKQMFETINQDAEDELEVKRRLTKGKLS